MAKSKEPTPLTEAIKEGISSAQAKAVLQAEQEQNLREAQQELQQMLAKRGLALRPIVSIVGNQIVSDVQLVVAPQQ